MKKLTIAALFGALLATPVMAAQYYKWIDDQGVTHYTETPPPETAKGATEVKVQTRTPSGAEAAVENLQKQREAATKSLTDAEKKKTPEKTSPSKADKAANAERCKKLQANLVIMETNGRVSELVEKGEKRYLTEEEKTKRMDDARKQIKVLCE